MEVSENMSFPSKCRSSQPKNGLDYNKDTSLPNQGLSRFKSLKGELAVQYQLIKIHHLALLEAPYIFQVSLRERYFFL